MTSRIRLLVVPLAAALSLLLAPAAAVADPGVIADAFRTTAEDNLAAETDYLRSISPDDNVTCRMEDLVAEGVPAVDYRLGVNRAHAYASAVAACASLDETSSYTVRMEIVFQSFDPGSRDWDDITRTGKAYSQSSLFGQGAVVGVNQYIFEDVNDPVLDRMMRAKYTLTDPRSRQQVKYSQPFLLSGGIAATIQ